MEEAFAAFPHNERFLQEKSEESNLADLFDRYYTRVYKYMHYRMVNSYVAEELTSQVFEQVLRKMNTFSPERAPFEVWLFAIARNACNDYYRRRKRWSWLPLESMRSLVSSQPGPDERAVQNEEQQKLLTALESLSDRERNIVALKFAGGFKNRQIAELTGLTESNVGVLLYRSLHRLREQLEGKE